MKEVEMKFMNLKDLEFKINEVIKEKELDEKYDILWKTIGSVKDIVSKILADDLKQNTKMYITEYKSNLVIKNTETRDEIIIKLKKKRSKDEYKIGVWSWAYYYAIQNVEIIDDEFKSIDDYINTTKKIVEDREKDNANLKADFEKQLKEHNMNFKEFYMIMQKYNSLNYTDRINYEKENGLYKGWL